MRARAIGVAALVALGLTSCGDPDLWARYQAEHDWWNAVRHVERIRIRPALATESDYAHAEAAFDQILNAFPPEEWSAAERVSRPLARDVAVISAQAGIAMGRLAEWQGRVEEALARYESVLATSGNLREVAAEAAVDRALALERLDRPIDAAEAWLRVAESFELIDDAGEVHPDIVQASGRAAKLYQDEGQAREARAALREAETRALDALGRRDPPAGRAELWQHVGETRLALGRLDDAADAWRSVAALGRTRLQRGRALLTIGEHYLAAGQPDTAVAYAEEARSGYRRLVAVEATLLLARSRRAAGDTEAALETYEDVLEEFPRSADACARARFERGRIYEDADNWVQARSQYRALSARYPTHALAFDAFLRIVDYHLRRGEVELARVEGRRSLETVDRIIAHQRGPETQFIARLTRARILTGMQEHEKAFEALAAFWQRYPDSEEGIDAAFEAAALAETALADESRAVELHRRVHSEVADADAKDRARAALERLTGNGAQES
jgi:tetratricopeptide (TPR) repeat protein